MRENTLKRRLCEGSAVNAWLSIPSAYSAEVMGHQGFDSVTVDLQHGMIGFEAAIAMLQAISSTPAVPLARVSKNDDALIMQLLDAGAYGIICPMISTAAEAARFAAACRYPPRGTRSFGPARGLLYGGPDYFARANDEILALGMIETTEAVLQIDAILRVAELDGIYVGPNDLCLAYGVAPRSEPAEEDVSDVILDLCRRTREVGKIAGIFCSSGQAAAMRIAQGFALVTPGNDVGQLVAGAKAAVGSTRAARG